MAPRRKALAAPARQVAARRTRNPRRRRTNPQRSLGALIVKGVNALMCAVPGAKIFKPVTDFMFKSFGFSTSSSDQLEGNFTGSINIFGMGAAFAVPLSSIIENTPLIPKHHDGNQVQLYTTFTHGQLLNIRVTVRPIGELSHRQGNLAVAFIPYSTSQSGSYYDAAVSIPTLQDVLVVPKAVQGSGTRTLSVNYRARGTQFCCLPHPLSTEIGLVLVSYQDLNRAKANEFAAEDFGAEIIISGAVRLSNPIPHVGFAAVDCAVIDKLADKTIRFGDFEVSDGVCEDLGECVKVTGHCSQVTMTHTLKVKEHLGPLGEPGGSPSSVVSMLSDAALSP